MIWAVMSITSPPSTVRSPHSSAASTKRPSQAGYWAGALAVIAAVIAGVVWLAVAYVDHQQQIDRFTRLMVPGSAVIQISDTSTRVLYFENVRHAPTPSLQQLGIRVTGPDGRTVHVSPYSRGDLRYDVPGESGLSGRAVASFHADNVSTYQIRTAPSSGVAGSLAIGNDILRDLVPDVIGAGALVLVVGGAGVAMVAVTRSRRSRSA